MKTNIARKYSVTALVLGLGFCGIQTSAQTGVSTDDQKRETPKVDASKLFDQAVSRAGKENKAILVHLGAPW